MKEIKAYLNAVAYERYTKQSKLTDYFTPTVYDFNYSVAIVRVTGTVPYVS